MTTPSVVDAPPTRFLSQCDFCDADVVFLKVHDVDSPFWGHQALEPGSGSDHTTTWCAKCGPKHRFTDLRLQSRNVRIGDGIWLADERRIRTITKVSGNEITVADARSVHHEQHEIVTIYR